MVLTVISDVRDTIWIGYLSKCIYLLLDCYMARRWRTGLIIVFFFDIVSTQNCVFKKQDPHLLNIISTGLQLALVAILLLVHLCIGFWQRRSNNRGNVPFKNPLLRKTKSSSGRAWISNRVRLFGGSFMTGICSPRYLIFLFLNLGHSICSICNKNQSYLRLCQHFHYIHYSRFNHLLFPLWPFHLPPFDEKNVHHNRYMSWNLLTKYPLMSPNPSKNLDGYMVGIAPLFRDYKDWSRSTNSILSWDLHSAISHFISWKCRGTFCGEFENYEENRSEEIHGGVLRSFGGGNSSKTESVQLLQWTWYFPP